MAASYWFYHWIIHSIDSFEQLIHSETKQVPASQCAYYPPYPPQTVLQITNITFRMYSMHIGTQTVTVLKSNWIDSLDLLKCRFIHKQNNAVFERLSCEFIWKYFSWWNREKSCNTVIFRQCKSLNMNFLFFEITHCSYANNPLLLQLS